MVEAFHDKYTALIPRQEGFEARQRLDTQRDGEATRKISTQFSKAVEKAGGAREATQGTHIPRRP